MRQWNKLIFIFCSLFLLSCSVHAQNDWRINPVNFKVKSKEEQIYYTLGGGGGYYLPDFRWVSTFRWKNPADTSQPSYLKTGLRRRIINDWWISAEGKYSLAPTCDYRWAELKLEKTLAKPWSFHTWGSGEWRRAATDSTLENYDLTMIAACLRWRPWKGCLWKGEVSSEHKSYETPSKSSQKMALSNELAYRLNNHNLKCTISESTREYPHNSWINYWYKSRRVEWSWKLAPRTVLTTKCGWNRRISGTGKESGKLELTGIFDHPRSPKNTVSLMISATKITAVYEPLSEEVEQESFPFSNLRGGIRWVKTVSPFSFRGELFGVQKDDSWELRCMLKTQLETEKIRWVLGLAPWGGFYPTDEKGYWLEVRFYP